MFNTRLFCIMMLVALCVVMARAENTFPRLDKVGDEFTFIINADPHVNNERPGQKRASPHNRLYREFIREVNGMTPQPAFVLFNGDNFERQAFPTSTKIFQEEALKLKALPILVAGNHDVRTFDVETIFGPVQQALNGTRAAQFGFDCGAWHFTVLPPPELITPENEAAYLEKLDAELKANAARPTMAFLHYHLLPVGLSQLEFYDYSIGQKNRLLDVLTRYGNVKYVISGHVHSGVMPSVKTVWTYKGTVFLIAPSPVRPRPFGEEFAEFTRDGGYYLKVEIKGKEARLTGKQIGNKAEHVYPAAFREFKPESDPRALTALWELPASESVVNGDFGEGMKGWLAPTRYQSEADPGYEAEVISNPDGGSGKNGRGKALRLSVKAKGQDWAYGEFSERYQVARVPQGGAPRLALRYRPLEAEKTAGGYVWLAGMKGREVAAVMLLKWGPPLEQRHPLPKVISYLITGGEQRGRGLAQLASEKRALVWDLPAETGTWHKLGFNMGEAFDTVNGAGAFRKLGVEKVLVGIGAWCMETEGSKSAALFGGIEVKGAAGTAGAVGGEKERSVIDGKGLAAGSAELGTIIKAEAPAAAGGKTKKKGKRAAAK